MEMQCKETRCPIKFDFFFFNIFGYTILVKRYEISVIFFKYLRNKISRLLVKSTILDIKAPVPGNGAKNLIAYFASARNRSSYIMINKRSFSRGLSLITKNER